MRKPYTVEVDPPGEQSIEEACRWWEEHSPARAQLIIDALEKAYRQVASRAGRPRAAVRTARLLGVEPARCCATLIVMDPADLRAFALRDRSPVEQLKREHWAREFREHGGLATFRAGHALYEYARRVRPDLPTERDRAEDLAHHVGLKRLLDRASRALAVR